MTRHSASHTDELSIRTVCAADDNCPRYSEGQIFERRDGSLTMTLVAFIPSDRGSEDDAPSRLITIDSHDRGRTWGEPRTMLEPEPGDHNINCPNYVRLDDQRVLFACAVCTRFEPNEPVQYDTVIMESYDDARTFGPPRRIIRGEPMCQSTTGVVRKLDSGRLIMPMDRQTGIFWTPTDHVVAIPWHSDDDGQTWQPSESTIDLPMRGAMEAHIEQCADGSLLMVMRTQLGAIFASRSHDEGQTWSKPQTTGVAAPESCPDLVRNPHNNDLILTWNDSPYDPSHGHFGRRSPLTVAVSTDMGRTWQHKKHIETDPAYAFSNPVMTVLTDETVAMSYWATKYTDSGNMCNHIDLKVALFPLCCLYDEPE